VQQIIKAYDEFASTPAGRVSQAWTAAPSEASGQAAPADAEPVSGAASSTNAGHQAAK
jgi:hypothetical protein